MKIAIIVRNAALLYPQEPDLMLPGFDGLLVIDKPTCMTSRDVVNRVLRWFPLRARIGHTGTLDPLATGVLVLAIGVGTRLTEYVQRMGKTYRAGILLGGTSDTDDADGQIVMNPHTNVASHDEVRHALDSFLGTIDQIPPAYSAAKVTGRRAYDLARKGHDVSLSPRPVTIYAIDIVGFAYPHLDIIVRCGKGTYIRSLARDLGERLGCGGYIASLRRTQVGCFHEADALLLDSAPEEARRRLLPIAHAVSELPRVTLDDADAVRLLHGQRIPCSIASSAEVAVFDHDGRLLAIAEATADQLHVTKGFIRAESV